VGKTTEVSYWYFHELKQNWKKWQSCSPYLCSWISCLIVRAHKVQRQR